LAEGVRLVDEGICENFPIRFILYSEALSKRGLKLIHALPDGFPVFKVDHFLLEELSDTETTQGIMAVFNLVSLPFPPKLDFLLILDSVRDPGNMGTILRTAEAAGVQGVLLSPHTTDAFAPKVVRSGMGAHFRLPIHTFSWTEIAKQCEGFSLFRSELGAPLNLYQADFTNPTAIIIGGEAEGVSRESLNLTAQAVSIPMPGQSESLNAAIATGILIYEVLRQRSTRK